MRYRRPNHRFPSDEVVVKCEPDQVDENVESIAVAVLPEELKVNGIPSNGFKGMNYL